MISVSILGLKNKEEMDLLNKSKFDYIHLDIMDGLFVSNKTKDFNYYYNLLKNNDKPLDIHFMVNDVISYIDEYKSLNPTYITFQIEAVKNPVLVVEHIKKYGIKAGIAISPNTDIKKIEPYLSIIDLVLVMSVEPGLGGQKFIDTSKDRINDLITLRESNDYNYLISVDGGINDTNYKLNTDIIVVGSFITNSKNYNLQLKRFFVK